MDEDGREHDARAHESLFAGRDGTASPPTITIAAVRELAGTPKRVSVLVGGVGRRRVATLLATQAMELGLAPGVAWTEEIAARAAWLERVNAAKALAMRRLTARARSKSEMAAWLESKGVDAGVAAEAVARLADMGLISDAQVEEDERRRALAKGLSGRALSERLASRGIGTADEDGNATHGVAGGVGGGVKEGVRGGADDETEGDGPRALEVARAELSRRSIDPADVNALARRVMGILARKGYEEHIAREAVIIALRERGLRVGGGSDE